MIRALLVDDEQPARERLRQLLTAHPDVEIVGEAEDGVQAAEQIAELTPDLVMLDIQMPGASGLDVAGSLGKPRPAVIFCTAYDQYAVDAVERSALDYLLKPVNRARLAAALDRVRAAGAPQGRDRALEQLSHATGLVPTRFLARRAASAWSPSLKWWRLRSTHHASGHRHRATVDAAHLPRSPAGSTTSAFQCRGPQSSVSTR